MDTNGSQAIDPLTYTPEDGRDVRSKILLSDYHFEALSSLYEHGSVSEAEFRNQFPELSDGMIDRWVESGLAVRRGPEVSILRSFSDEFDPSVEIEGVNGGFVETAGDNFGYHTIRGLVQRSIARVSDRVIDLDLEALKIFRLVATSGGKIEKQALAAQGCSDVTLRRLCDFGVLTVSEPRLEKSDRFIL